MAKRNLERMRQLLLMAEAVEIAENDEDVSGFVDLDNLQIGDGYQLTLLRDGGWIEGRDAQQGCFRITNSGHDYLDAVRDQGIWERTKTAVSETGGNATLEIVKSLALGFLKKKIETHTGVQL